MVDGLDGKRFFASEFKYSSQLNNDAFCLGRLMDARTSRTSPLGAKSDSDKTCRGKTTMSTRARILRMQGATRNLRLGLLIFLRIDDSHRAFFKGQVNQEAGSFKSRVSVFGRQSNHRGWGWPLYKRARARGRGRRDESRGGIV